MAAILSRPQCVKALSLPWWLNHWWHGMRRSQVISIHDITLVIPEISINKISRNDIEWKYILMGQCKKDVTPLLTHWSYVFLALTHRYILYFLLPKYVCDIEMCVSCRITQQKGWLRTSWDFYNIYENLVWFIRGRSVPWDGALSYWSWDKMAAMYFQVHKNLHILIKIWLKFVPSDPVENKSVLVQIMAWHCSDDKPLCESVLDILIEWE